MSDTTSDTDEQPEADPLVERAAEPDAADDTEAEPEKTKRSTGLRKPLAPARGAMAATAMAAVPATGLTASVLYGNFGPMGVVAAGGVAAAAGGVALVARGKKHTTETKDRKGKSGLPPHPPHPLGGLKGLMGRAGEKAAARRDTMAQQRAARQQGRSSGVAGLLNRRGAAPGSVAAGGRRGRSGSGAVAGRAAQRGGVAGRSSTGAAGRGVTASRQQAVGKPGAGRPAAAGRSAAGTVGRPGGCGVVPAPRGAGAAGRYTNPATGRPMSAGQVARAIRHQQRTQRIVTQGSYPQQVGRWAWRHKHVAGYALGAVAGLGGLAVALPVAAVAGVGLGAVGVARHPAVRRLRRKLWVELKYRWILAGRWMRRGWRKWRGINEPPLVGEFVPGDIPTPQSTPEPDPDIVDADVVPDILGETGPAAQPELVMQPPPDRQSHLLTAGDTRTKEKKPMSSPFETVIETLATVSFTPESGADAEAAIDAIPGVLSAAATSIRGVLASVAEHLPQAADSLEHLSGIADAVDGISTQADEQIAGWKDSANWVWQGQD